MVGDDIHSSSLFPKQSYSFTVFVGSSDIRAKILFVDTDPLVWYILIFAQGRVLYVGGWAVAMPYTRI